MTGFDENLESCNFCENWKIFKIVASNKASVSEYSQKRSLIFQIFDEVNFKNVRLFCDQLHKMISRGMSENNALTRILIGLLNPPTHHDF